MVDAQLVQDFNCLVHEIRLRQTKLGLLIGAPNLGKIALLHSIANCKPLNLRAELGSRLSDMSYKRRRKIKLSCLEVLRASCESACSNKDFGMMPSAAKNRPEQTLQVDEKLLLWYEQALTRTEANA